MSDPLALHSVNQGTTDLISWRQVLSWKFTHGTLSQGVVKASPLSTDGFRNQEARCMLKLERCGMKLDEFQIFDGGTGLPGQSDTLSAGLCRVCCVGVYFIL